MRGPRFPTGAFRFQNGLVRDAALLLAALLPGPLSGPPPPPPKVTSEVRVERIVLDAWVTDDRTGAVAGLSAADFRVAVDGVPTEVESTEWIGAGEREAPPSVDVPAEGTSTAPGRVVVVFVQGDLARFRTTGALQAGHHLDPFLASLLPSDRVAVVSFDSHLKLRLDFTSDRERIRRAYFDSIRFGTPPPAAPAEAPGPSLAMLLDAGEAHRVSNVDRALELVARALAPIPGGKALLFFGWGLRVEHGLYRPVDDHPALRALEEARVTVFPLDITLADGHSLGPDLEKMAERTGGTYESLFEFPSGAIGRLAGRLKGHYVLVCVRPDVPRGLHRLEVSLATRPEHVAARTYTVDP